MTIWDMVCPVGNAGGFVKEENWGDWSKVSGLTLAMLLMIRRESGWPMVIHKYAYETTGHQGKQHPRGTAADWHFVTDVPYSEQITKVLSILDNYQLADFIGLGIYPFWNNRGFHTDTRGSKARWSFDKDGKMVSFEEGLKWA